MSIAHIRAVVARGVPAYLRKVSLCPTRRQQEDEGDPMRETVAPRMTSRPLLIAAAAAIVAVGGTALLWASFGATMFFETIRAGLVACFG